MKTALIILVCVVAYAAAQIVSNPPVSESPPSVSPCHPGQIQSWPDLVNCRRFHLCYSEVLYHMWCAPGRNYDVASESCLVGGQCAAGAFPIDLPVELTEIEMF